MSSCERFILRLLDSFAGGAGFIGHLYLLIALSRSLPAQGILVIGFMWFLKVA